MKGLYKWALILVGFMSSVSFSHAQLVTQATVQRPYDPVIIKASHFPEFVGQPISSLHIWVYHDSTGAWGPIPFQIDPVSTNGSYFGYKSGLLSQRDEVLFMAKDLGDRVPDGYWPADDSSKVFPRYEIFVRDTLHPSQSGWAYFFESASLDSVSPVDYVDYDSVNDKILSGNYQIGFGEDNGLPNTIVIPQATLHPDTSFFERFKFRFKVYAKKKFLWTWVTKTIVLSEMDLQRVPNDKFVDGPVRVIYPLSVKIYIKTGFSGVPPLEEGPYALPMTFYKNSLQLDAKDLNISLTDLPYGIDAKLKLIRFSLDFNQYATGMDYYSKYNSAVLIDGQPDAFNYTLDPGQLNYFMVRGDQGTLVTVELVPRIGQSQKPYYWDKNNPLNTTGDGTSDTGDKRSYGDSGFLITGENITGKMNFVNYTYFFPPNQPIDLGDSLVANMKDPLAVQIVPQTFDTIPPAPVTNLLVMSVRDSSVVLSWAAPGDDSTAGTAMAYDLRYSTFAPSLVSNPMIVYKYASTRVLTTPNPAPGGTIESCEVRGLNPLKTYYFMLTTLDDAGNRSALSNIAQATLLDVELLDFSVQVNEAGAVLQWKTASERNNYGFEVQRKRSGSHFEKIGFVPGNGTTADPHVYNFTDSTVTQGEVTYRLKQIDFDGKFTLLKSVTVTVNLPKQFELAQNYPNPFNPDTKIRFSLPERSFVTLTIYNNLGQVVRKLVSENRPAGAYVAVWNGRDDMGQPVSSGVYFYEIKAGKFHKIRKMLLMR
ncbi:MAG: T9SS type A sorting domain-containing protein [Calditrichaeota bacterium]|nr:T9SS type A sorting domain-containing protein [Calditrichota bacterium]